MRSPPPGLQSRISRLDKPGLPELGNENPGSRKTHWLVCKQNQIEDEQQSLMFCNGYNVLRQELFQNCISLKDVALVNPKYINLMYVRSLQCLFKKSKKITENAGACIIS